MLFRHLFYLFATFYSASAFAQTVAMPAGEQHAVESVSHVRLNGDTIEFNADAFAMSADALIEDLLPRFPGLVVWSDRTITYSGEEVQRVLVHGKSFLGSDKELALRYIAKDAVMKVQIYDTRSEEDRLENPYNPVYEINVLLKAGLEQLYFGNLTLAGGSQERHEGSVSMHIANKRLQAALAYSGNNTNKYLSDIGQLLKNSAFKSVSGKADLDSSFLRTGVLRQQVLGARIQYDFGKAEEVNRMNVVTGDILTRWDRTLLRDSSFTQLSSLNGFGTHSRSTVSGSEQALQSQRGNFQYLLDMDYNHRVWSFNTHLALNHENRHTESSINRLNNYADSRSRLELFGNSTYRDKGMNFVTNVSIGERSSREPNNNFLESLRYSFEVSSRLNQNRSDSRNSSVYQDLLNEVVRSNTNRLYNSLHDEDAHSFAATIAYKSFYFSNRLHLYRSATDAKASDIINDGYALNEALSHLSRFKQLIYNPSLGYGLQLYSQNLAGRMYEYLGIQGEFGYRIHSERNESSMTYRNLQRDYSSPLPKAAIIYTHSQAERFVADAALRYAFEETYPTLQHLRPLYDDIDPSYRYFGGPNLQKSRNQSLTAKLDFRELKVYGMSWLVQASYERSRNGLSDSIRYAEGQQQVYTINIEGPMQSFATEGRLARAFPLGWDQSLNLTVGVSRSRKDRFQYVDGQKQNVQINTKSASLDANYTRVNKVQVGWSSHWYRYDQAGTTPSPNNYSSTEWSSGLSLSYELTSKWDIASNATARFNTSNFHKNEALIWNAKSTYRLLRDRNLQIKLAAFDLLRQFKGVYQRNNVTEFTAGYRNHLNPYIMLSISFFPKQIGQ